MRTIKPKPDYGPAICHPERKAYVKAERWCQSCYETRRSASKQADIVESDDLVGRLQRLGEELGVEVLSRQQAARFSGAGSREPKDLAEAVKWADRELICAIPEAAAALRRQLKGRAELRAAEILLRSFVIPTPDGPRRFLSDPARTDKVATGTQVVIGLSVTPGAGGTVQLGKIVGTVQAGGVGEKAPPAQ